jgi:hypothetical protein
MYNYVESSSCDRQLRQVVLRQIITDLETITDIAYYLRNKGEELKPLNPDQIKDIEEKLNVRLPEIYKQFLRLMGKGAGSYMKGSSAFYNEILFLKKWAIELVSENKIDSLPGDAFVFWMHQGYQIAYFRLSEGNDPPVYFFSESTNNRGFRLAEETLTSFLLSQLKFFYKYPEI